MLLEITILIVMLLLYTITNKEGFKNYKSITVTPNISIHDKIQINSFYRGSFVDDIAKNISRLYPIYKINNTNGSNANLKITNAKTNILSIVQDESLNKFIQSNKNNNIRFISCVGIEQLSLIVPLNSDIRVWKDLNNKNIGTLNKDTGVSGILDKLFENYNINANIIPTKIDKIIDNFKENKIDAFFIITSHPSNIIESINKDIPIRFIGINSLNKDIIYKIFPYSKKSYIDMSIYNIVNKLPIETLNFKLNLVCHKDFRPSNSYNIIKKLFSKFVFMKINGNDNYKKQMQYYNPNDLYLNNTLYKLHKGVKKYYINTGIISYNDNKHCKYYVGIKKCNNKKLNHFRLL